MYPQAYIEYLVHFHGDRDYFECHEVLEEYWKEVEPGHKDSIWVGLIQLAVSCYHHRRGNFNGAMRTFLKALNIFRSKRDLIPNLGLDPVQLFPLLQKQFVRLENKEPYISFYLPICSSSLEKACLEKCKMIGADWGTSSDMMNQKLIHRHKLRDRTDVIREREEAIRMRKGNK